MYYFWDYANYYRIQIYLSAFVNKQTYVLNIFPYIKNSILTSDYNNFLCVMLEFLYEILPSTGGESYIFIYLVAGILPLIYVIYLFVLKLYKVLHMNKNRTVMLFLCMAIVCCCPLFYHAALLGQPDIIGLIFIFLLFGYLMDYSFENVDIGKMFCIFITTLYLIIVRRWYIVNAGLNCQ